MAKKKYAEKKIIVEVPEAIESVTTTSSTTDEEVTVVYPEDLKDEESTLDSDNHAHEPSQELEERIENLEKQEDLSGRVEKLEGELTELNGLYAALFTNLEEHMQHIPVPGPSTTPRRHDTYEVKEDGEKLAKIAKKLWGVSGRYVEIASLNDITDATDLKKGQILKLPK